MVTEKNTIIRVKDENDEETIHYPVTKADNVTGGLTFTESATRDNVLSGETLPTLLGKIKKFFTDLKAVAFSGSYNDLSNKPTSMTPTAHTSTGTTYGAGNGTYYGHVKLSGSTSSASGESGGVAATPSAVKSAYDKANAAIPQTQKGAANGVASLDSTSKVPVAQIPEGVGVLPRIEITAASGTVITVSNGTKTLTQTSAGTTTAFDVPSFGTWTIKAGNYNKALTVDAVKIYKITALALADATWEQIAEISKSGNASIIWSIGDEKDITVSSETDDIEEQTITLVIVDFDHDDLTKGGKAGITFGMKNLMAGTRQMNSTNTNAGGFTGSEMYAWLQDELLPSLPEDLQEVLKFVDKKTSAGSQSTEINTDSMKLFLFSEIEIFGTLTRSVEGEGEHYPYFATATQRIKYLANGTGSANSWWERSPYANASTYFCYVISSGNADNSSASSTRGVCFGFCV